MSYPEYFAVIVNLVHYQRLRQLQHGTAEPSSIHLSASTNFLSTQFFVNNCKSK